jgi:hypothetical protein
MSELGEIIGVSDESIRGWRDERSKPRRRYSNVLDDLRAVSLILLEGGLPPESIHNWFHSWPPGHSGAPRPIDVLATDPQAVAAAAVAELEEDYDVMADILYAARRPLDREEADTEKRIESEPAEVDEDFTEISAAAKRKRIRTQQRVIASSDNP